MNSPVLHNYYNFIEITLIKYTYFRATCMYYKLWLRFLPRGTVVINCYFQGWNWQVLGHLHWSTPQSHDVWTVPLLRERGLSWLLILCDSDSDVWEFSSSPELDWHSSELSSSELDDSSENSLLLNKVAFYESKNTHCIHENVIQIFPSITDRSADSYANKQSFLINNFASECCLASWFYDTHIHTDM